MTQLLKVKEPLNSNMEKGHRGGKAKGDAPRIGTERLTDTGPACSELEIEHS